MRRLRDRHWRGIARRKHGQWEAHALKTGRLLYSNTTETGVLYYSVHDPFKPWGCG